VSRREETLQVLEDRNQVALTPLATDAQSAGEARARAPVRRWPGYHGKGEPHTRSTGVVTRRTV